MSTVQKQQKKNTSFLGVFDSTSDTQQKDHSLQAEDFVDKDGYTLEERINDLIADHKELDELPAERLDKAEACYTQKTGKSYVPFPQYYLLWSEGCFSDKVNKIDWKEEARLYNAIDDDVRQKAYTTYYDKTGKRDYETPTLQWLISHGYLESPKQKTNGPQHDHSTVTHTTKPDSANMLPGILALIFIVGVFCIAIFGVRRQNRKNKKDLKKGKKNKKANSMNKEDTLDDTDVEDAWPSTASEKLKNGQVQAGSQILVASDAANSQTNVKNFVYGENYGSTNDAYVSESRKTKKSDDSSKPKNTVPGWVAFLVVAVIVTVFVLAAVYGDKSKMTWGNQKSQKQIWCEQMGRQWKQTGYNTGMCLDAPKKKGSIQKMKDFVKSFRK